ncbi:hypothetical protein M0805_004830 [Coniferiporia weirii]|nr:hypothetical protein M0805_004830 [Coniferiporia weirii]
MAFKPFLKFAAVAACVLPTLGLTISIGPITISLPLGNLLPRPNTCTIKPLGNGHDDTDQVLNAIDKCGKNGHVILEAGEFNITRKMTWNLENAQVDLYGVLSFVPDIQYWLNSNNTYRVVYIQDQASWFVVSGNNFIIDAHNEGGINGNGQPWWDYYTTVPRLDGDGRPLSLTLYQATHGEIRDFSIKDQPFWCNAVAESSNILYDGMTCNATNTNPAFFGQNIVPNTDGINTYRSDSVTLKNWDITCGDDCIAVKGNTTNLSVSSLTCRGGNGIAFGSLGQYDQFEEIVENVLFEDVTHIRLNASIQPGMKNGVYFKSWTDTVNGVPPSGGGGGKGYAKNIVIQRMSLDQVDSPVHLYQTNGGSSTDTPSYYQFSDLSFIDWSGSSTGNKIVDIECSTNAPCPGMTFQNFDITTPNKEAPEYICINVESEKGLSAPCNSTGKA